MWLSTYDPLATVVTAGVPRSTVSSASANSVAFRCSRCGFARIPASRGLFRPLLGGPLRLPTATARAVGRVLGFDAPAVGFARMPLPTTTLPSLHSLHYRHRHHTTITILPPPHCHHHTTTITLPPHYYHQLPPHYHCSQAHQPTTTTTLPTVITTLPPPHYHHHATITTLPPPHCHHHTTTITAPPQHHHHHSTTTTLPPPHCTTATAAPGIGPSPAATELRDAWWRGPLASAHHSCFA